MRATARTICDALGLTEVELSILVVGDAAMHELNRNWRGKDQPTDVLSFSQWEGRGPKGPFLGDVVISGDTAARQAREQRHDLEREFERLLIHGVLHLIGYDHIRGGAAAQRMRRAERRLVGLLSSARRRTHLRSNR